MMDSHNETPRTFTPEQQQAMYAIVKELTQILLPKGRGGMLRNKAYRLLQEMDNPQPPRFVVIPIEENFFIQDTQTGLIPAIAFTTKDSAQAAAIRLNVKALTSDDKLTPHKISSFLQALDSPPAATEPAQTGRYTVSEWIRDGKYAVWRDGAVVVKSYDTEAEAQAECQRLNAESLPQCETHRHAAYFKQLRQLAINSGVIAHGWNNACVETGQRAFTDSHYYVDDKIKVWATQENPYGLKVEWRENNNPVLGIYPDGKVVRCHGEFASVRAYLDSLNAAHGNGGLPAWERYIVECDNYDALIPLYIILDVNTGRKMDGVYLDESEAQKKADLLNSGGA